MAMIRWSYMAMLAFTVCGSFWLEIFLKVEVLRRVKRVALSIAPPALLFLIWDAIAITHKNWTFDDRQILGIYPVAHIPLEEFLFFLVVPIAAIMTIEAVRSVKNRWLVGDE